MIYDSQIYIICLNGMGFAIYIYKKDFFMVNGQEGTKGVMARNIMSGHYKQCYGNYLTIL